MAKLSAQAMRGLPGERVQTKPEIPFSKGEGDLAARAERVQRKLRAMAYVAV